MLLRPHLYREIYWNLDRLPERVGNPGDVIQGKVPIVDSTGGRLYLVLMGRFASPGPESLHSFGRAPGKDGPGSLGTVAPEFFLSLDQGDSPPDPSGKGP